MKNPFKAKPGGSYTRRVVTLAQEGKGKEGAELMLQGEMHYLGKLQAALIPFPTDDTALIVVLLRQFADALEKSTPETKRNVGLVQKAFIPLNLQLNFKNQEVKKNGNS